MSDEKCSRPAAIRRYWPGKEPDLVCLLHGLDTEKVARAMGFYVHMEGLTNDEIAEGSACSCSPGFSQSVQVKTDDE
jgi:hypothetical protein